MNSDVNTQTDQVKRLTTTLKNQEREMDVKEREKPVEEEGVSFLLNSC